MLALALAAEAALRFGLGLGDPPLARLDPETEYELVPSARYRRWGNSIDINAFGMRTRDHAALPAASERRLLLIGDSVVYGTHFLDQEETVARVLEGRLAGTARLAGCSILALPMAVSSWGPENQRAFLAREGTFGAEAAVLVLSAHDLHDVPQHEPNILPYRLDRSRSAIGDAAAIVLERLWRPRPKGAPPSMEVRAARSLAALDAMAAQLEAAGIRPVLAYHPTQGERLREAEVPARARFRDWAAARGLRFLDLGVEIAETDGYRDSIHPDAEGAARIARALADALGPELRECPGPAAE